MLNSMLDFLSDNPKPAILNKNYGSLQNEHTSLKYYFEEILTLLSRGIPPQPILIHLLDKYLSLSKKNFFGQIITEQQELANEMKRTATLETLNRTTNEINPHDDFIWLLSAYYSVFPFLYPKLTNQNIKNALTIRDMNDIYLNTVIKKFFQQHSASSMRYLSAQPETAEIAHLIGEDSSLLEYYTDALKNGDYLDRKVAWNHLENPLKYATGAQVREILLPTIIDMLDITKESKESKEPREKPSTRIFLVLEKIKPLIDKTSVKDIETEIIPSLLKLYKQKDCSPFLEDTFLYCIEKMNGEASKRCLLDVLRSTFMAEKVTYQTHIALKPLLAIISKLNKDESDKIIEEILPKIKTLNVHYDLAFLKKLRHEGFYVNENLFQLANQPILDFNEKFLTNVEQHGKLGRLGGSRTELFSDHMTPAQIQRFFSAVSLKDLYVTKEPWEISLFLTSLEPLLKDDPSLHARIFEFLFEKRHLKEFVSVLTVYMKTHDFSDESSKKMLMDLCHLAVVKVMAGNYDHHKEYYKLLEACASMMTEDEIKSHILCVVEVNKINKPSDYNYFRNMHDIFCQIFSKINDQEILARFFNEFRRSHFECSITDSHDLFAIFINKMNPALFPSITQTLLKDEMSDRRDLDRTAYFLTLIYNKSKEHYRDIPYFCKGMQYAETEAEAKCAMM